MTFFVVLINTADLFTNITRYITQEVTFLEVLQLQYLFLPQCVVFALPMALLFSVSYSMGTLYANNELVAVFASGVSLRRFIVPLTFIGLLLSLLLFIVQDRFAIPLSKEKEALSAQLLGGQSVNLDQADVNIQAVGGRIVYHAGFYESELQRLTNVTVVVRDENLKINVHIFADWAEWKDDIWQFHGVTYINRGSDTGVFLVEERAVHSQADVNLSPDNFQNQFGDVDEMSVSESRVYIDFLQKSGFPFREPLTKYHERFSFALTPLIVTLLSVAIGGSYRKNILGLSLLVSLSLSIVYYCIQLFSGLLATIGVLDSIVGAWAGTIFTAVLAVFLLNRAKT